MRELLEFLRFELQQAGIRLELELLEPSPHIRLDAKYLKQALLNIVKNAIAAMPQGGTLRIETRRKGDTLQLKVSDTGVGIPEENLDKIFEPYFTTREFGSGLGLTLVYKIVKEHQGEIAVSSRPGEGTTFTLSFPVPQGERRSARRPEGAPMKYNILVVDDEKNIREGLAKLLALEGHQTIPAADGREALALLERGDIDLVVTDLRMPNLSGRGAAAARAGRLPRGCR